MDAPARTYVAEADGEILGTYFIKTNHDGPGDHVCNCGYMVASAARGRGLATAMCEHSQTIALELGYQAMQFNFVASSNEVPGGSGTSWGSTPSAGSQSAFAHPELGYVDALVMYKWLAPAAE